jgi:predicted Zn-dependent protease
MSASPTFHKALLQLDHGRHEAGEASLREAIAMAANEPDEITWTAASVCLADLLVQTGRPAEAEPILREVTARDRDDDVLDREMRRAEELLAAIASD